MAGRFSVEAVFKAVDRMTAPVTRMQNRVGKLTRSMSDGMDTVNRSVDNVTGAMSRGATTVVASLGAVTATLGTTIALFNKSSVEADQLANSVQYNVDKLEALAGAVAPAGFELDNVVDLIEEMNNKLGESAGLGETITPVKESLAILGLSFEAIMALKPEQQFERIANAALAMKDAQKAAAAADILLGGEANKIIGVLRQQGGTIEDIIAQQERLNFRTDASRKGAALFVRQMQLTTRAASSLGAEISGLAGKHLAPLLRKLTDWAAANKQIIADNIVRAITTTVDAVQYLVENLETITLWLKRIGIGIGVFIALSVVLKSLIAIMTAVNLVMAANPVVLIVLGILALIAALASAVIWWDEIKAALVSFADTVTGKVAGAFEWLKEVFAGLPAPVKAALAVISGPIGWLIGAATLLKDGWSPIKAFFADLWGSVGATFDVGLGSLREASTAAWDGIVGIFSAALDKVTGIVDAVTGKASAIVDTISSIGGGVAEFFGFDGGVQAPQVVSPSERVARSIDEQRTTSTAEVTIRDETGRAEHTAGQLGTGVALKRSGDF